VGAFSANIARFPLANVDSVFLTLSVKLDLASVQITIFVLSVLETQPAEILQIVILIVLCKTSLVHLGSYLAQLQDAY